MSHNDYLPLTFNRDHHLRRRLFTEESFQHKARTNLNWLGWLLDQHAAPAQLVLDPMGGAGSILLAAVNQHPTITGDIEAQWARLQAQNAHRIRTTQLFTASIVTCHWDAAFLPLPLSSIPTIATSPPYFDLFSNWNRSHGTPMDGQHIGPTGLCYGFHPQQIANLHTYEDYLRAMRRVYHECWRVLRPGGILILIVGDKVRKHRQVPITTDTETLCLANGFRLLARHQRRTQPSHFRRIHAQKNGPDYPLISVETALILQKQNHRLPTKYAIIEAPKTNSRPGQQLLDKMIAYAGHTADQPLILTKKGLLAGHTPNVLWSGDHLRKARDRREWSFAIVRNLVTKHHLGAGDAIDLHVTDRYARYLQQRLNTLGCRCTIPTAHHNLGQKLTWYTQALLDQDQTRIQRRHNTGGPNEDRLTLAR